MFTCILIDDEKDSLDTLEWKIQNYCPNIKILDKIRDSRLAIDKIIEKEPDCIFLDINMPKISGFDLLTSLGDLDCYIVLVTAYEEYSLQAIKASVFDYLLKPVDKNDLIFLERKLKKDALRKITHKKKKKIEGSLRKKIGFQTKGSINFYDFEEIIFLKAEGSYTTIFLTQNRTETLSKTLKEVISMFSDNQTFFRVHNSYYINLNHVAKYYKNQGGTIIMSNNKHVSVSRSKKEEILQKMF